MSYDLNILVIGQENPSNLPFKTSIEVKNELQEFLRYHEIWNYMTGKKGTWYCLGKTEDGWFNSLSIIDADFDANLEDIMMPYWINDIDTQSNLKPIIINESYKDDFSKIIKFLIDQSPVKTIMFLTRYQGGDKEIICGVLSLKEFYELLEKRKILFNTCYIISSIC